MLEIGMCHSREILVTAEQTASFLGSGAVEVYATPMMILLMESTAAACVQGELSPGMVTVGTLLHVDHGAATPVGMKVRCRAELLEADGRRLVFRVEAFDERGRIGGGTHERFIVDAAKFNSKAKAKLETN